MLPMLRGRGYRVDASVVAASGTVQGAPPGRATAAYASLCTFTRTRLCRWVRTPTAARPHAYRSLEDRLRQGRLPALHPDIASGARAPPWTRHSGKPPACTVGLSRAEGDQIPRDGKPH
jgi:hypothetical protein